MTTETHSPISVFWRHAGISLYFSSCSSVWRVVGCIPRSIVILGYYTVYSSYTVGVQHHHNPGILYWQINFYNNKHNLPSKTIKCLWDKSIPILVSLAIILILWQNHYCIVEFRPSISCLNSKIILFVLKVVWFLAEWYYFVWQEGSLVELQNHFTALSESKFVLQEIWFVMFLF